MAGEIQRDVILDPPSYVSNAAIVTLVVVAVAAVAAITFVALAQFKVNPLDQLSFPWTVALWGAGGALALAGISFLVIRKCLHVGELKNYQNERQLFRE
jgi:hypothetical protein